LRPNDFFGIRNTYWNEDNDELVLASTVNTWILHESGSGHGLMV